MQKGRVQCIQTLPVASGRIGGGPYTSGRNEPGQTHPELEFPLQAPGTSGAQGEPGEKGRKTIFLLMQLRYSC